MLGCGILYINQILLLDFVTSIVISLSLLSGILKLGKLMSDFCSQYVSLEIRGRQGKMSVPQKIANDSQKHFHEGHSVPQKNSQCKYMTSVCPPKYHYALRKYCSILHFSCGFNRLTNQ